LIITANLRVSEQNMVSYYSSFLLGKALKIPSFEEFFENGELPFFQKENFLSELSSLVYQFHLKFFPLDGRIFLRAPTVEEVLNYVPPVSERELEEERDFRSLLKEKDLPGGKGMNLFNLIDISPYGLFKELLPKNWREVEEIYYSLRTEKHDKISHALRFFLRNKILSSKAFASIVGKYLEVEYGDYIYVEEKGDFRELLDDIKINVTFRPSIFEENYRVFYPEKLNILSSNITLSDLAVLLLLVELYVSSYESEIVFSPNLLKKIYSFLPPPLVVKEGNKAFLFTVASKTLLRMLERVGREEGKIVYPFSLFYAYFMMARTSVLSKKFEEEGKVISTKEDLSKTIRELKSVVSPVNVEEKPFPYFPEFSMDVSGLNAAFEVKGTLLEELKERGAVSGKEIESLADRFELNVPEMYRGKTSIVQPVGVMEFEWEKFKKAVYSMKLHRVIFDKWMRENEA